MVEGIINEAFRRYGLDPSIGLRIAQIESSLNPNARNPRSSAGGLFQFIDGTARQYGLTNKFDPAANADAGARFTRDNVTALRKALGREPTAGEIYLAHQQGAGGARKLLTNPDAFAADLVGEQAVMLNAGRRDMTARDFAGLWDRKMTGVKAPPMPAPEAPQPVPVEAPADPGLGAVFANIAQQFRQQPQRPMQEEETPRRRADPRRLTAGLTGPLVVGA